MRRFPMVKPHRIHAGVLLGPSPLRLRACQSGRRDTNLNVAATYCDHIICLAAGVVVSAGPVEEVYTSDNLSWIYGWPIHVMTTDGGERSTGPTLRHRQCRKPARPHFRKDNPMKYCVMSVALLVSLALCPQPVLPPKRAMGGRLPCWDGRGGNRRNDCQGRNRYQLFKLRCANHHSCPCRCCRHPRGGGQDRC